MTRRRGPAVGAASEVPADQGNLGGWYVEPGISLESGRLVLGGVDADESGGSVEAAPQDLLARFVKLQNAKDLAIQRFAHRWGLLGLVRRMEDPARHGGRCIAADSESIDDWRKWSLGASLLWNCGSEISRRGGLDDGLRTDLAWFHMETGGRQIRWPRWVPKREQLWTRHQKRGPRGRPVVGPRSSRLEFPVGTTGRPDPDPDSNVKPFSAIVLSIAQSIPEGQLASSPCRGCSKWFAPARSTEKYCTQCQRRRVGDRDRQRRRRSLKAREAQTLDLD